MSEAIDFNERLRERQHREAERLEAEERAAPLPRLSNYTRFARFMRYLLPLVAVALVALLVLWPRFQEDTLSVGRFGVTDEPVANEDGTTANRAHFEGVDGKDRPFTISAARAFQPNEQLDRIVLDRPEADIVMRDGSWVAVSAERGDYHQDRELLELRGQVNLFHDQGYELYTESVDVDLQSGVAESRTAVQGQGPFGHITSEGIQVRDNGDTVIFTGKTELTVYPEDEAQ
jgi:lipopolysaccharide export system protein LptC